MRAGRSLRTRVAATVTLAVAGCTIALTLLAYAVESGGSRQRFVNASMATARSDFRQAGETAARVPAAHRLDAVRDFVSGRGVGYRISPPRRQSGGAYTACVADRFPPGMDAIVTPGPLRHDWVTLCSGRDYLAVYGSPVAGVSLAEFFDFQPARAQLAHLRNVLFWVALAGLLLAGVLGTLVGRRIARPVQDAARTARRLGAGELSVRMPVQGAREPAELSELGEAFNDMAARLQQSQAQQRRFVADVAHELRTPLSAMVAAADAISSSDEARRRRSAELLVGQTRRLTGLVDDLLEISRFDAGQAQLELEEVDLAELVRDAVTVVAPNRPVAVVAAGDAIARVDPRRVHTVVRNLVGNAVQHGAPPVRVVLDGDATDVTITVSDAGAGVPPELAPVVFDRFVRGDPARAAGAGTGTAGLGLAIAAENAALHGGSVTIAADRPNAFVVRLPRRLDHPDPPTRHPSTASHPRTALHPPTALSAPPARG